MNSWPYVTGGIPDERFARGKVPMTKEEVRVICLAKLRLPVGGVLWDVGAGTGSVAVEAAVLGRGQVYAVERDPQGLELIRANVERFGLGNVRVVGGEAPGVLADLPDPDRVLVGGSGGRLEEILLEADRRLRPGGVVVVPAITVETVGRTLEAFRRLGYREETVTVSVAKARGVGGNHMWTALNPITVIAGRRDEAGDG